VVVKRSGGRGDYGHRRGRPKLPYDKRCARTHRNARTTITTLPQQQHTDGGNEAKRHRRRV